MNNITCIINLENLWHNQRKSLTKPSKIETFDFWVLHFCWKLSLFRILPVIIFLCFCISNLVTATTDTVLPTTMGTTTKTNMETTAGTDPALCDGELDFTGSLGGVASPNYPEPYGNMCEYTYRITVSEGAIMRLRYEIFQVGEGDKLEIFESGSSLPLVSDL